MKHILPVLLLLCLLCGCGREAPVREPAALPETTSVPAEASRGLYDAGSVLEAKYGGALRAYPLRGFSEVTGFRAMGEDLLVFSGDQVTNLVLLTGEDLHAAASVTLDCFLSPRDPSLQTGDGELSFFDPVTRETLVLDKGLKQVSHISAPQDLVGTPILSSDRNTLYYCSASAVRAWDLESVIRRTLKEMACPELTALRLHAGDSVLQCTLTEGETERHLFLSAETGRLLYERKGEMTLSTFDGRYYAAFPTGMTQALLFGEGEQPPLALTPGEITADCVFLPRRNGAVSVFAAGSRELRLDYYDLDSGVRRAALTLETDSRPLALEGTSGGVYILIYSGDYGCDAIYRWDFGGTDVEDPAVCTGPYYTAQSPDLEGLARCQAYAAELSQRFGVEILVWKDAVAEQPWDYDLEPEYLVSVIQRELKLLEQRLSYYPGNILPDTASHFTGLRICLVRAITGTAESGSLDSATGLQFLIGTDAYVALAAGEYSDRALYHELFHVMETHILNESIAFDQWDALNPAGFSYDYDYRANAQRDAGVYLEGENRAFVDTYSMSFPKEDRARIMEYAMLSGNQELFRGQIMQEKLKTLCQGIREAYGLKKSSETFLWEQYLRKPLAYQK